METPIESTDAEKARNDVTPLEVLFSSPIILKPDKARLFLEKCHDDTKEDSTMKDFKTRVNENAKKCEIWPEDKTWKDVIDENEESSSEKKHFKILTTFINKDGTPRKKPVDVDPNSVTDLLGVKRNKYSHRNLLSEEILKTMGWGKEISNKYEFCDEKFLAYWTSRFPKLLPFLWEQYKEPMSEKNPGGAYPPFFKSQYSSICLFDRKTQFGEQLSSALSQNLEEGWLEDRFTFGKDSVMTLEFRTMETSHFDVDKYNFLEVDVHGSGEQRVICKFYKVLDDTITLSSKNSISLAYKEPDHSRESFTGKIVVCNKLSDLNNYFSKCNIRNLQRQSRLIVFVNRDHEIEQVAKKAVVNKFSKVLGIGIINKPVNWSDLTATKQKTLIKQADIIIQGITVKFEDFLNNAANSDASNNILLNLYGTHLNEMVKNKRIEIFTSDKNIKPPTSKQLYIRRLMYSRGNVGAEFFEKMLGKSGDKFIIIHSETIEIPNSQDIKFTKVNSLNEFRNVDINESKSNMFYVEEPVKDFSKVSITFESSVSRNICVHVFEYIENNSFEWVSTPHGSFAGIANSLYEAAKLGATSQDKLLNNILKFKRRGDIVFISDAPGMGKTELLMNFAQKVKEKGKSCVLWFEMREIVEQLVGKKVSKEWVINAIIDLSYSKSYEKALAKQLLNFSALGIEFDLMVDGLDEIQPEHKEIAYDVLKVFQKEIPWARVWVTGRDYLLEEVTTKLGVLGYKFLPFTKTEQVSYLITFWRESWNNFCKEGDPPCDSKLHEFANKLLEKRTFQNETHLAGIPLQCKMLAEIFEEKALNKDFKLDDTAAFGLHTMYEEMLKKKIRIYWTDKQKLSVTTGPREINNFLVYLSIKLIFSEEKANEFRVHLLIPLKKHHRMMLEADILRHGVVQSLSPLRFIHRSFAEFIVASFATQEVKECLESSETLNSLEAIMEQFLTKNIFAPEKSCKVGFKVLHMDMIRFLNMTLETVLLNISNTFKERGSTPLYYKLAKVFKNPNIKLPCLIAPKNMSARMEYNFCIEDFKNIYTILVLLGNTLNLFVFALNNHLFEFAKSMIDEMNFGPEHWHQVREFDKSKLGVLHHILGGGKHFETSSFISYVVRKNQSILDERDSYGETPYLRAIGFVSTLTFSEEFIHLAFDSTNWIEIFKIERKTACEDCTKAYKTIDIMYRDHCLTLDRPDLCEQFSNKPDEYTALLLDRRLKYGKLCCKRKEGILSSYRLYEYHKVVIGKLVKLGVDINATDNDGNTALHLVFSLYFFFRPPDPLNFDWPINVVEYLLAHTYNHAHLNQFNKIGNTPLLVLLNSYCCKYDFSEPQNTNKLANKHTSFMNLMFDKFKKYGTNFNARDIKRDETILHKAIKRKYPLHLIKSLIQHGASVLDKNSKGQLAIHLAVMRGDILVKKHLLRTNPNCQFAEDNYGKTMRDYEGDFSDPEESLSTLFTLSSSNE